jgi:hypothetical protein
MTDNIKKDYARSERFKKYNKIRITTSYRPKRESLLEQQKR